MSRGKNNLTMPRRHSQGQLPKDKRSKTISNYFQEKELVNKYFPDYPLLWEKFSEITVPEKRAWSGPLKEIFASQADSERWALDIKVPSDNHQQEVFWHAQDRVHYQDIDRRPFRQINERLLVAIVPCMANYTFKREALSCNNSCICATFTPGELSEIQWLLLGALVNELKKQKICYEFVHFG